MTETLKILKERLNAYYEAELIVLRGQSYQIGTKRLDRADLAEIRKAISELKSEIANIENGGKRKVARVIPRDL